MMLVELPDPVRAALPAEPIKPVRAHFVLYRNAEHWADLTAEVRTDQDAHLSMRPTRYAADYIRLNMSPVTLDPRPGWANLRVRIEYNGNNLGDGVYSQPLAFWIAEPTDWPSGLVRFGDMYGWPESHDPAFRQPAVWTLAVRRCA